MLQVIMLFRELISSMTSSVIFFWKVETFYFLLLQRYYIKVYAFMAFFPCAIYRIEQ